MCDHLFPGWGSNGVTVTGLHKVTAIFRNCNVTGLHFENMESNGTWGYLIGIKLHYLIQCQKAQLVHGQRNHEKYFVHVSLIYDDLAIVEVHFQSLVKRTFAPLFKNALSVSDIYGMK